MMHCTPPPDLIAMNMELNRAPYVIDSPKNAGDFDENGFAKDWGGLEHFKKHGGDCENFATAKCAALWGTAYKCRVNVGYYKTTPHAWAVVSHGGCEWRLDNLWDEVKNSH